MKARQTLLFPLMLFATFCSAQQVETRQRQTASIVLSGHTDLHLTADEEAIASGVTVDLQSSSAWLFFDNVKPNAVIQHYSGNILVQGQPLDAETNARVVVCRQGAVVIPHTRTFNALTLYSQTDYQGEQEHMQAHYYYSNCPPDSAPARRFLKRSICEYMASMPS